MERVMLFIIILKKNQEFQVSSLLKKPGWDSKSEAEQKKRIVLLFDLNKMDQESIKLQSTTNKRVRQVKGFGLTADESRYITQHTLSRIST
jgi:hypothetical protein